MKDQTQTEIITAADIANVGLQSSLNGANSTEHKGSCSPINVPENDSNSDSIVHQPGIVKEAEIGQENDIHLIEDDEVKSPPQGPMCEICEKAVTKYTCPRCSLRTCSLPCVLEHKSRLGCCGERDKTAFVDMSKYSDMHLLSDYRFLEEAETKFYSHKMVTQKKGRSMHGGMPYHPNKRTKLLIAAAQKRGVKLRMLTPALSKNRVNTSFYTVSSDSIEWHIDWHFVASNTLVKDKKVQEGTTLLEAAGKYTNVVEYPHMRKAMEEYMKEKLDNSQFLLKVEGLPANRPRYFRLKPEATVAANVNGHCITEYPSIYILPPSYTGEEYQILSREDVPFMMAENARHVLRHFPALDVRPQLESQILNPSSSLYSAA